MKKLRLIFPLLLCFLFLFEVGASYREIDFSPFPLNIKSETLLNGHWKSDSSHLEIVRTENHFMKDEHGLFIIYEVDSKNPDSKKISGFIFHDHLEKSYKRGFWVEGEVEIRPFTLYGLENRVSELFNEGYCVQNMYMLKMKEQMFVRKECDDSQ